MFPRMLNEYAPLYRLHDQMNRLFEGFFEDMPRTRLLSDAFPAMNTWEDGTAAYVEAELPGIRLEDIEVLVMGNELTIRGQRKLEDHPNASWHRRERVGGQFHRTLSLPWDIDADKVEARLENGVLTVKLPKSEQAKPRKIKLLGQ